MGKSVTIHASPDIPWHVRRGVFFAEGLAKAGIPHRFSRSRVRESGIPLLLGTTFWRNIEDDDLGDYILIDRCSFGDTEKFVSIVWNGHGRLGDHKVPQRPNPARWEKHAVPLRPWKRMGRRVVLCGQTEPYSANYLRCEDWYAKVAPHATHFRVHPAGYNPTKLPTIYVPSVVDEASRDWRDVRQAITLNSSVGVQAVMEGIPTVTMDPAAMAWDVSTHTIEEAPVYPDRIPWCHRLAWTQWSDDEIREGAMWAYHLP